MKKLSAAFGVKGDSAKEGEAFNRELQVSCLCKARHSLADMS